MFLTIKDIARETIVMTDYLVVFGKTIFRGYEKNFTEGRKKGDSITLRNFHDVDVEEYDGINKPTGQSVTETPTELKLEKQFVAAIKVEDVDLTLRIEDFSEQVLMRGVRPMVKKVEQYFLSQVKKVNKYAVKLGDDAPSTLQHVSDISAQATRQGFTQGEPRYFLMDPETKSSIQGGAPETITANTRGDDGSAFREANFGKILNLVGVESDLVPATVLSSLASGSNTNAIVASQGTQSVALEGLIDTNTVSHGDILEFTDSVSGVKSTVVAAQDLVVSGTSANLLIDSVDVDVAAGSAFTVKNIGFNCVYNSKAFAGCVVPLQAPMSKKNTGAAYYINEPSMGLGFRVVMDYDYPSDVIYIDCLAGAEHIQHDLAFRVNSAR